MRVFPLVLIAIGVFGVLKHFGLIDAAFVHLFWPLLLIGIGVALLARGPRWRGDLHEHMQDRWERRMHRHFGPGWASLSEEERDRFRAGMRQWRVHGGTEGGTDSGTDSGTDGGGHGGAVGDSPVPTAAGGGSSSKPSAQPPAPGEQR